MIHRVSFFLFFASFFPTLEFDHMCDKLRQQLFHLKGATCPCDLTDVCWQKMHQFWYMLMKLEQKQVALGASPVLFLHLDCSCKNQNTPCTTLQDSSQCNKNDQPWEILRESSQTVSVLHLHWCRPIFNCLRLITLLYEEAEQCWTQSIMVWLYFRCLWASAK